jgi:hypothetical protein
MARSLRSMASHQGRPLLVAALLACTLVALGLTAAGADGRSAKTLGKTKTTPKPSCPAPKRDSYPASKDCLTYASVTGFQTHAAGRKGIFKVPERGHIVGWSVDMSKPRSSERKIFNELFDGHPLARISILNKQDGANFKLTKQSPAVDLNSSYGERPIFTLQKPLGVQKGRIVALTTKTWVPNFAHGAGVGQRDRWRASRRKGRCGNDRTKTSRQNRNDLLASKPQQKVGSTKSYRCSYSSARVLYWAYFVPSSK